MGGNRSEKDRNDVWVLLKEYGAAGRDLLFPGSHCLLCGRKGIKGYLCKGCMTKRCNHSWGRSCDCCGVFIRPERHRCRWCQVEVPMFIENAKAVAPYGGYLRTQLLLFKYEGRKSLAKGFGTLLAELVRQEFAGVVFDLIAAVPVTEQTLLKRGYNQSLLLAQTVSRILGVPCGKHLLRKRSDVASQTRLNRAERIANLRSAIMPGQEDLTGKHILLIDDIFTTGATSYGCGRALKQMGAAGVWVATVAAGVEWQQWEAEESAAQKNP